MEVSVLLTTYNQEKYIAQALDSALMQETDFDYEIIILEDCSTDATREIVLDHQKRHPDQIRLRLAARNECSNKPFAEAFQASTSTYIAMLDGDDYWTSPEKLQTQVEFLRSHQECALCFHNALRIYEDGSRVPVRHNAAGQKPISTIEDLWERNFIAGSAAMVRKEALSEFPAWFYESKYGDWPLYLLCTQHGKIGYIDEIFGVYRIHSGGAWSGLDPIQKLESLIAFYQSMNVNFGFRFGRVVDSMISAHKKELAAMRALVNTVQTLLPPRVRVIAMSNAHEEPPRLEGHQMYVFPDQHGTSVERHFASGSAGSAEAPWIQFGKTYEFRLHREDAKQTPPLVSVLVTSSNAGSSAPSSGSPKSENGAFIEASPNPVPTGTKHGKTTIKWSTGDGSKGVIHVVETNLLAHYPVDGQEALAHLERLRANGGEFLLAPRNAFKFFERYPELKQHLDRGYRLVQDNEICQLYDLRETAPKS